MEEFQFQSNFIYRIKRKSGSKKIKRRNRNKERNRKQTAAATAIIVLIPMENRTQQTDEVALFAQKQYAEALAKVKQTLKEQPNNSNALLNKALYQYRLGHLAQSLSDINQSLLADPLNYHAYFNLFSMQAKRGEKEPAFKNLCCALSVCNLIMGRKTKQEHYLERAIELSFNNKEARALKSILKLQQNKKIDALNQINYALYLEPSHPLLQIIQKKVYQSMGMKELKGKQSPKKSKFERLDTCKEVPPADKIDQEMQRLLAEFNQIVRSVAEEGAFVVENEQQAEEPVSAPTIAESKIKWVEAKPLTIVKPTEDTVNFTVSPVCMSDKDNSTQHSSDRYDTLMVNDSMELSQPLKNDPVPISQDSFSSSKLADLSISNISQNSKIKVSRVRGKNVLDISDCLVNLLEQSSRSGILPEDSLDESDDNKLELKLPMDSLKSLGANEKIVLAIQRVKTNENGQKQQVEELYEIVANQNGFQLLQRPKEAVAS